MANDRAQRIWGKTSRLEQARVQSKYSQLFAGYYPDVKKIAADRDDSLRDEGFPESDGFDGSS